MTRRAVVLLAIAASGCMLDRSPHFGEVGLDASTAMDAGRSDGGAMDATQLPIDGGQDGGPLPPPDGGQDAFVCDHGTCTNCSCSIGCSCTYECSGRCSVGCSGASCAVHGPTLTDTQLTCEGAATCTLDVDTLSSSTTRCSGGSTCNVTCAGGTTCALVCSDASQCTLDCGATAICNLDCQGAQQRDCWNGGRHTFTCRTGRCP